MLEIARNQVPGDRIERIDVGDLRDELPGGPFDLVVSALAIHPLAAAEKQVLFGRVREGLRRDGRFVLGDVVVPEDPADAVTPLTPGYDKPDRADDLLEWLTAARFASAVTWSANDLVVIAADVEG